jgi:hypothetical protein
MTYIISIDGVDEMPKYFPQSFSDLNKDQTVEIIIGNEWHEGKVIDSNSNYAQVQPNDTSFGIAITDLTCIRVDSVSNRLTL